MSGWFRAPKRSKESPSEETLIRVCVVSHDHALVTEVHKDLFTGFSTRGGYDFDPSHPDFQEYCDVLFVDLRSEPSPGHAPDRAAPSASVGNPQGLAFIDSIRKSVSHPPIVALCDADAGDFGRAVVRHGAYERLSAPLNMSQLRLALQRAYEFRLAETKLESFLSQETAAHENPRGAARRKSASAGRAPVAAARPLRRISKARPHFVPSRLIVGFVLGCVLFFAGLVAVRTIFSGMGDALASAGLAADSNGATSGSAVIAEPRSGGSGSSHVFPLSALAQTGQPSEPAPRSFSAQTQIADELGARSSVPGYQPPAIIERITPRYSLEARASRLQGTVRIRAVIGTDGIPRGLARASGDPTLAQIAMDAITLWRYDPATIDGRPVESEVIIPIDFRLPD